MTFSIGLHSNQKLNSIGGTFAATKPLYDENHSTIQNIMTVDCAEKEQRRD